MNTLNLIWAKLDDNFCTQNMLNEQNKAKAKLQKEKCRCFLVFLTLAWILEFLVCIKQMIPFSFCFFVFFSITNMIFFYILHKQQVFILDIMTISLLTTIGSIYFTMFKCSEYLIVLQIMYSIFPSFALLLTRSFYGSIIVYITNLSQSIYSYSQIQTLNINININNECFKEEINIFPLIITLSSGIGFILLGIFWIILESRKKMIITLHSQNDQVEKINIRLSKANNELIKTLESNKNLLLSISHEVRNPLNIISGSADLLYDNDLDKNSTNHVETIKTTCDLLNYLVTNLLFGAKNGENEFEIIKISIDMQTFLANIWNSNKILIQKKDLEGHMFISKNMPYRLEIDSMRVSQIIYNIISNSTKFTQEGYIALIFTWIEVTELDQSLFSCNDEDSFIQFLYSKKYLKIKNSPNQNQNQNLPDNSIYSGEIRSDEANIQEGKTSVSKGLLPYLRVKRAKTFTYRNLFNNYYDISFSNESFPDHIINKSISPNLATKNNGFLKIQAIDSGCGICEEDKDKLFKKYIQVGSGESRRLGSGLGLWITKNLCLKMGGDIQVNSRVDQGSVFTAVIKCS